MQPTLNPGKRPEKIKLVGRYVTLAPADAGHGEGIYAATSGADNDSLWDYLGDGPYRELDEFQSAWERKCASNDAQFFAILVGGGDGKVATAATAVGYASLMRVDVANGCIEVGNILYSRGLQRTPAATEVQYLLARYVFEELGNRRYEWKCNALNAPSRRAALRYGFQFEGIFRQHIIIKGRNRDTAWFSMLDSEWPARKAAFEAWLDPGNFDEEGRQRAALSRGVSVTVVPGDSV